MLIIEKNIPIPAAGSARGRSSWPLRDMQVGDSVLVAGDRVKTVRQVIYYVTKKTGFAFVTRKVDGGLRVWRTA